MAEALLGPVFEKLLSMVENEFATMSRIKEKAEKLRRTSELIKAVLQDAEQKQMTDDEPVKLWLQELKDAVYVLDDILDECSIESHRLVGPSSFKPRNIVFRYRIGNKLKIISRRFDEIAESKNKLSLRVGESSGGDRGVAEWRETSSTIYERRIYGRDDDKEKIVEFLLNQAHASDLLSIYAIVGLGGLGKTTLAKMVYNDHRVSSTFNTKIWVCVSEDFSRKRILCSIIRSISNENFDAMEFAVIERKVQELLQNKTYLLVLDDVWNMNDKLKSGLTQREGNKFKGVLSCGSKGSSILVSTRDRDVPTIMEACQAHHLSGLSDDECWLLFKECAFGLNREEREELVAIGKEIVKKCGGLPLAAQALGSLLRTKTEEREWIDVKESRLWDLRNENSILPELRLSYVHLTPILKQCFAFCAIFPKDTVIKKEDLIHLWMANGFISSQGSSEVEYVGHTIWKELCQKSFFQDIEINDEGDICFKMHDLIHDLAQSVTGSRSVTGSGTVTVSECMVLENSNETGLSRSTHHIYSVLSSSEGAFKKVAFKKIECLRTLYDSSLHRDSFIDTEISSCFHSLRFLSHSLKLLSSLGNLIHLRYLELYYLHIKTLPDSICSLKKLEILKLEKLFHLRCLSKHLTCLQNIRHLVIKDCSLLSQMCPNIGKLCCLKTLSVYIVDSKTGHSLTELRDLNLGGKLRIVGLHNVGSPLEARDANLRDKKDLQKLDLAWGISQSCVTNPELVIEMLQPPSNLKLLRISNYSGLCFPPKGMLRNLTCLQTLEIDYFPELKELSSELFNLIALEDLKIRSCNKLESLPEHGWEGLCSLRTLTFSNCEGLRSLPDGIQHLTSLNNLKFYYCPALESLPEHGWEGLCSLRTLTFCLSQGLRSLPDGIQHLTSLGKLIIWGCPTLEKRCKEGTGEDWHKIAHIPHKRISSNFVKRRTLF